MTKQQKAAYNQAIDDVLRTADMDKPRNGNFCFISKKVITDLKLEL